MTGRAQLWLRLALTALLWLLAGRVRSLTDLSPANFSLHPYRSGVVDEDDAAGFPPLLTETQSEPLFAQRNAAAGLDVVFINLNSSRQRRHFLYETLQFYGFSRRQVRRVAAFAPEEVVVAPALADAALCQHLTRDAFDGLVALQDALEANASSPAGRRVFVEALCGRKKNSARELAVTLSHLLALHAALADATRPFALVLEDDLHLYMEVDFAALLASAPPDFAVLQLATSNDHSVANLWRVFLRHKLLWVRRKDRDDYWCAGAYIVRKAALRPVVERIFSQLRAAIDAADAAPRRFRANVVAAYPSPCFPRACCVNGRLQAVSDAPSAAAAAVGVAVAVAAEGNASAAEPLAPLCVRSARGLQADAFVFALAPGATYMLTLPLLTNSPTGNVSTVHQRHVDWHQAAFRRGRRIFALLRAGRVPVALPSLFNAHCRIGAGLVLRAPAEAEALTAYAAELREQRDWVDGVAAQRLSVLDA